MFKQAINKSYKSDGGPLVIKLSWTELLMVVGIGREHINRKLSLLA